MDCCFEVSAPGKVILHGEHSVVHGKRAIACALGSRITVSVTSSPQSAISFVMPSLSEEKMTVSIKSFMDVCQNVVEEKDASTVIQTFCNKEFGSIPNPFVSLALSCCLYGYHRVFHDKLMDAPGVNLTVKSELPIGAGLGSSAAFNTSIACAFLLLSREILPPNNCKNTLTEVKDEESLQMIDQLAYKMESIVHSTPSGIDNSIATYGRAVSFQNGVVMKVDSLPELQLLIVDTGVARSTKTLVANVREYREKYPTVIDPILNAMHSIAVEAEYVLCRFQGEGDNAKALEEYGRLVTTNHSLLCSLGVSHPSLDRICYIASKHGFSSKLTGAGGGGCAFILLSNLQNIEELKQELSAEGFRFWKASLGGPGVMVKQL